MSTVLWFKSVRFVIRPKEKNHLHRPHFHAIKDNCEVSIDLVTFEILGVEGFSEKDVKRIIEHAQDPQNVEALMTKWKEYHGKEEA